VALWRMDAPVNLFLDLELDLGLGIPLLPDAAPRAQSRSVAIVVASHSMETSSKIYFAAYLRSCVL
jgi:hypothetical protein